MKLKMGETVHITNEKLAEGLKGHRFLVDVYGWDEPQLVEVTGNHQELGLEVKAVPRDA